MYIQHAIYIVIYIIISYNIQPLNLNILNFSISKTQTQIQSMHVTV